MNADQLRDVHTMCLGILERVADDLKQAPVGGVEFREIYIEFLACAIGMGRDVAALPGNEGDVEFDRQLQVAIARTNLL